MDAQTTEWYSPHIKPVRSGVYETQIHVDDDVTQPVFHFGFSYWDGKKWSNTRATIQLASKEICKRYGFLNGFQNKHWRGLTKEVAHGIKGDA